MQKPPKGQTAGSTAKSTARNADSQKHPWHSESHDGLSIPEQILGPHPHFSISLFLQQFCPAEPIVRKFSNPSARLSFLPDVYCDVEAKPESCLLSVSTSLESDFLNHLETVSGVNCST